MNLEASDNMEMYHFLAFSPLLTSLEKKNALLASYQLRKSYKRSEMTRFYKKKTN